MKPLRLIQKYTRNYTLPLAVTVVSMLLLVSMQLIIPWIIKTLIDTVTNTEIASASLNTISILTLAAFGVYILRGFLQRMPVED